MQIRFVRPRARLATLGLVVVVLGGVACSALSGAVPTSPTSPASNVKAAQPVSPPVPAPVSPGGLAVGAPAPAVASDAAGAQQRAVTSGAAQSSTVVDSSAQILDRMVIRTAQLTVEVPDMESALARARQIASQGGGFVSASNTHIERVNDQDRMVADLTLQIRSDAA